MIYTNDIEGWITPVQLDWLHQQSKSHKTIVEIGSHLGRSTTALCDGCPGMVFAVDPWEGTRFHAFIANLGVRKNLWIFRQKSVEARREFEEKSVDMVFIDGDHSYESVKEDILHWLPACRYLICGHDYIDAGASQWPGVIRAVNEAFPANCIQLVESIWAVKLDGKGNPCPL